MSPQLPRLNAAGAVFSISSVLLLGVALVLGLAGPGCREQISAPIDRNLPPQTILVGVPGDSTTTFYRVSMFWYGNDPDGEVVGYEWAITDSIPGGGEDAIQYTYTTRTDSAFVFTVEEGREVLGRRFYVRAVDNEGKRDPTPAWAFFAIRNSGIPTAWFTRSRAVGPGGELKEITSTSRRAPTDTIPYGWGLDFAWTGRDTDLAMNPDGTIDTVGYVAGYTYHLSPLELTYLGGDVSDSTAAYEADRLSSGNYVMFVRARDDAGLSSLDPAIRTFVYNKDPVTYFTREAVEEGSPDSFKAFYASVASMDAGDFHPYRDGDTLSLTLAGVKTYANIRAYDPDPPYEIVAYEARQIRDSGFWRSLGPDLVFRQNTPQHTGTYRLMCRSMDAHGRWDGTPDTIVFHVNLTPRFVGEWDFYGTPWEQSPVAGASYDLSDTAVFPDTASMRIRFAAYDPDVESRRVEFTHRFASYPLRDGGPYGSESLYQAAWLSGNPATTEEHGACWFVNRNATLQSGARLRRGRYVLAIQAREFYSSVADRQRYGARVTERMVEFYVN